MSDESETSDINLLEQLATGVSIESSEESSESDAGTSKRRTRSRGKHVATTQDASDNDSDVAYLDDELDQDYAAKSDKSDSTDFTDSNDEEYVVGSSKKRSSRKISLKTRKSRKTPRKDSRQGTSKRTDAESDSDDDLECDDMRGMIEKLQSGNSRFVDRFIGDADEDIDNEDEPVSNENMPRFNESDVSDDEEQEEVWDDLTGGVKRSKKSMRLSLGLPKRRNLPAILSGMLGEANICMARNDLTQAENLCREVIREHWSDPDAYIILSQIYEKRGDAVKALNYKLTSCKFSPSDFDSWVTSAEAALELKDFKKAASCLGHALAVRNQSSVTEEQIREAYDNRAIIFETLKEPRRAARAYKCLLQSFLEQRRLTNIEKSNALKCATKLANIYAFSDNMPTDMEKAIETLSTCMDLCGKDCQDAHWTNAMQLYLKLLNSANRDVEVMLFVINRFHIPLEDVFKPENLDYSENDLQPLISKRTLQIDLKKLGSGLHTIDEVFLTRLVVALINQHCLNSTSKLAERILSLDVSTYGELLVEVANAYFRIDERKQALPFYAKIFQSDRYDTHNFALNYADCLLKEGNRQLAIDVYYSKLAADRSRTDVRRLLAEQLVIEKRFKAAYHIAHRDFFKKVPLEVRAVGRKRVNHGLCPCLDLDYLRVRVTVLWATHRFKILLSTIIRLLSNDMSILHHPREYISVIFHKNYRWLRENLSETRMKLRKEGYVKPTPRYAYVGSSLNREEVIKYFLMALQVMGTQRLAMDQTVLQDKAIQLVLSTHTSKILQGEEVKAINYYGLLLLYHLKCPNVIYPYAKEIVWRDPANNELVSLFACIMSKIHPDLRHKRVIDRVITKHPQALALKTMRANVTFHSGQYRKAALQYMELVDQYKPDLDSNPAHLSFLCLRIVISFLHLNFQRHETCRNERMTQIAEYFAAYKWLRGGSTQEVMYNLGRVYHSLELWAPAIECYEKALDSSHPSIVHGDMPDETTFQLNQEIAFNLSLVYSRLKNRSQALKMINSIIV